MSGKHLNQSQRNKLEALLQIHTPKQQILSVIGCSRSTLYREIKRGTVKQLDSELRPYFVYSAAASLARYKEVNSVKKGRPLLLANDARLIKHLEDYIGNKKFSPAAALREIELQELNITRISVTTCYRYIYNRYLKVRAIDLPVGRYKDRKVYQRKYISKKHRLDKSISERPAHVQHRDIVGDWEMDTVVGKAAGPSRCLLVLTERKTRYEIVMLMREKTVREVARCLNHIKSDFRDDFPKVFRSITCDNGSEFNSAALLEQFAPVYYCHPYSSWERGSNENQNKLVRRFCPKGKSMERVTQAHADYITLWMNNYPREVLGWKRPADVFADEMSKIGVSFSA